MAIKKLGFILASLLMHLDAVAMDQHEITEPNIFSLATSELSQDAAVAYHLKWADEQYSTSHPKQHQLGVALLRLLVGERAKDLNIGEVKIEVGVQYDHIDIWVYIGSKAVLIIEDKTNTFEHGDQIARYLKVASKWKDSNETPWGEARVLATYLKTGNESRKSAPVNDEINKVYRSDLLRVLVDHSETGDDIINQFRIYLQQWENDTKSYLSVPVKDTWSYRAIEGYYMDLEAALPVENWEYVSNQSGGFVAFYWNWVSVSGLNCKLYLQIEGGKCLKIRVSDAQDSDGEAIRAHASLRWELLSRLRDVVARDKYSVLVIEKSGRYKAGWTGGVASVDNYIAIGESGLIDMQATVSNLKLVADLLSELAG